jgi:hypothetical protein
VFGYFLLHFSYYVRLEAFTATELDKIFSSSLMMEVKMISETLGFYPQLTRLVAREDFIDFSYCCIFTNCGLLDRDAM